nr:A24 family peptidase [Nakamurella aerolata]
MLPYRNYSREGCGAHEYRVGRRRWRRGRCRRHHCLDCRNPVVRHLDRPDQPPPARRDRAVRGPRGCYSIFLAPLVDDRIAVTAYGVFAVAILSAALVDVAEMRLPDLITLPLIGVAVAVLPWLTDGDGWDHARPIFGLLAAGAWAFLVAILAGQSLGDIKLAAAIGGWLAWHSWLTLAAGVMVGQILVVAAVGIRGYRRRRVGLPVDDTPLGPARPGPARPGPALAAGAVVGLVIGLT